MNHHIVPPIIDCVPCRKAPTAAPPRGSSFYHPIMAESNEDDDERVFRMRRMRTSPPPSGTKLRLHPDAPWAGAPISFVEA